ncbi:uncharacterized protein MAL13P1.304-like isoform X2 [Condylostylus longicornis]|nr:uncharacterized protein MAL13P1.304-like isoform X2 [Condylostylus longicornis]XP_055388206.1 uncharacterized protein MAL13P1.304-like isoform X2 [Condylostylus longicornis]
MLVADSGHHTKPTNYPIAIHSRKCSSSSIISLSPSQSSILSVKKSSAISLNNSLKKLPPISSFFNKNLLQKDSLLESKAINTTVSSSLLSATKSITDPKNEDKNSSLQKVVTNNSTTLIIPSFRSQHHEEFAGECSTSSNNKQKSTEILRRLTQTNTIPPTISHRIPNSDSTSNDSLNLEMCYFKPIKPVPITPKKGNLVIKRPLPKRIKPKRRKCDVFIGPKKGQMPILFSTLTAFKRCSAFYSNNETTALQSSSVIPELDLYPLVENTNNSKNKIKDKQTNNLNQKATKEYKNAFYLKKCQVVVKREFGICFKSKLKAKSKNRLTKITKRKGNLKNFKTNVHGFRGFKSDLDKTHADTINNEEVFNLRNNKRFKGNKNLSNKIDEAIVVNEEEITNTRRKLRSRDTSVTKSNYRLSTDNFESQNSSKSEIKFTPKGNKTKAAKKGNIIKTSKKNLIPNESEYFSDIDVSEKNKPKSTRASRSKKVNSQTNSKLNSLRFKRINSLALDKIVDCFNVQNKNLDETGLEENNLGCFKESTKVLRAKRKCNENAITEANSSISNENKSKRGGKNEDTLEENKLESDINITKKFKIEASNETNLQRTTRSKEKDELLKSDYEFALKLQMEFEAEIFPIEPVANRTRNTISRMNLTCNESDNSSSIPEMTSKQINSNYNDRDNQQSLQTKSNYASTSINRNSNDLNLEKMENNYKIDDKANVNLKRNLKLSKTGKRNLKESKSKSAKRFFVPLKG